MNPLEFHGSKVEKDPQEFFNEVYTILVITRVATKEQAELSTHQLKGLAQIWFTQWKMKRVDNDPIYLEKFKAIILNCIFLIKLRKAKMIEFINLKQGSRIVRECSLRFNNILEYAPILVVDP